MTARRLPRLPLAPVAAAVVFSWLALTPSLLPRPALFQGLLCGVAAALGYGVGSLVRWAGRRTGRWPAAGSPRQAWRWAGTVEVIGTLAVLFWYARWSRTLRADLGVEPTSLGHVTVVALSGIVFFLLLLLLSRGLRALGRRLGRLIGKVAPAPVATLVGGLVVALLTVAVLDNVVATRILGALDGAFSVIDTEFTDDVEPPSVPELSAGPGSLVRWDELGRLGRAFVDNAPSAADVAALHLGEVGTGSEAEQPIRVYVGSTDTGIAALRDQAELAVRELERTGGFDRRVLNVATGTGRGWVNENQVQALEYMYAGDTATVSMQYSHLPSWLSFLVDGERARDAGRALFDAVYAHWSGLPADARPLLVVSGESLGSYGGEAAFTGLTDLASRTDGALFVGPSGNNTLWRAITDARDPGTPEVLPAYDGGATVRFAELPGDWDSPGPWEGTKIGYLQHASDPITWWTWSLAWSKPDWLREDRGRNVLPQTRWIPVLTMLQLAADQLVANSVPDGIGHQFGQEPVRAWARILPPEGWTEADTDRLAAHLREVVPGLLI